MRRRLVSFILLLFLLVGPISITISRSVSDDETLESFNVGVGNAVAYLSVPFHYQTNEYYCGPAALEMVFDYYGGDILQIEIADVARTHPYVTFTDELRRAAHFSNLSTSLGDELPHSISGYSARRVGYVAFEQWGLTIDDLKTLVDEGEPLIVLMWWTPSKVYGHYRVVLGYNETHIIMHDPWNKDSWGGKYGGANTTMTYSLFLDLWEYSGNWGLWIHPWVVELQLPSTVAKGDDFEVIADITYPCSKLSSLADYPAFYCKATIELQEGLELALGETAQHSLGSIAAGDSLQTAWSIYADENGFYNISVTATGIVEGLVAAHETYPFYSYEDEIGGSSLSTLSIINQTCRVHNIDTGLNYTAIQEAIDAPETEDGHTIFVEEGTYYEHVSVAKSIKLVGESRDTVIIDGNTKGTVIWVSADNVSIIDITIRNAGRTWGPPPRTGYPDSCILGNGVMHVRVENNTFSGTAVCVWLVYSSFVNISDNIVFDATYAGIVGYSSSSIMICRNLVYHCGLMGIHLDGGSNDCKIADNAVMNNLEGIELERQSTRNLIEDNHLLNNNASIVLNRCGRLNVFRGNNMTSSQYNLIVLGYDLDSFLQDIDDSNIANNKTVYYLTNLHDLTISPSTYPNPGYIAVVNCTNVAIRDFDVTHNGDGVLLAYSTKCILTNITLRGNRGPLMCGGLTFYESNNNTVINNDISNNSQAVCLCHSDGNRFYHNSFVYNDRQVVSDFLSPFSDESSGYFSSNVWDNGLEGNYWSDYTGTDGNREGIGDLPYAIDTNNQDDYPLMGTFSSFKTALGYHVNIISNSTIEDFEYFESNSTIKMYVSNMTATQTFGFCRMCIPKSLMSPPYTVTIDDGLTKVLDFNGTIYDDDTYRWIYFAYEDSVHEVNILPEFPSFISLLILLTALTMIIMGTLVAVMIYRRKRSK